MAQLDPSIILQARQPQIESPVNNLAKLMQVQGLQQQNQLGQMKMDEYRTAGERRNKLAALLQGQYDTPEARESALLQGGFMDEATKLGTDRRANQKSDLEIDSSRQKLAADRYGAFKKTLGALSQRQDLNKDLVMQAGQELVAAGIIPAQMYQASIANMPDDPNALRMRLREGVVGQMAPDKILEFFAPKAEKIDNGQQIGFRDMNPNSPTYGQETGGAPIQKQQTPDSVASNETTRRGQNMTDSRARERLEFDRGNAITDSGGPNQAGLAKRYGKAPPGYRWKEDGTAEAIPGGPADIKAGESGAKAQGRKDAAALAAGNVLSAVADAKKLVGLNTTGPGSMLSKVPGTDARDLQAKLDTIKANLGFDRLQQMREMSPTGGALGAVAVQELIALQSTVASLDQAQSAKELEKSLTKIEGHYNKWFDAVNGTTSPKAEPTASPQDAQARAWAQANPNDPRAKEIMQRLGGR